MKAARSICVMMFLVVQAMAQPDITPEARSAPNLVYHNQLRRVLMLDGFIKEPLMEQTKIWAWNGKKWELLSDNGPLARMFGGVSYDSKRNRVVLYGGRSWPTEKMIITSDTWEWDEKQWKLISDSVAGLGSRHHITMMYDEFESMTWLAGGVKLSDDRETWIWPHDIWGWNGRSWTRIRDGGPKGRISTMSYDSKRHETIIFGGSPAEGEPETLYNDTWIWNGQTWRKHTGTNPPARNGHAMTYDSERRVILLFGGWSNNGRVKLGDMWQWDGKDWSEIKLMGKKPSGRGIAGMAYDPHRKVAVLFGGDGENGKLKDTWEWDGVKWSEIKS